MKGNWVTINNKSGSGSGGNYFSNKTQGGGNSTGGTGGGSDGINTHGGAYADGYDYAPGKHAYNISFNSIIKQTSNPQHGYLVPEKAINLRNNSLTDKEIAALVGNLQYQRLDLDVFDVSNNKIGFGGVENLFYGLRFDNTLAGRYIITMNFSNNLIGDDGAKYMADSLAMGRFPNLKSLDVSGNQITTTGEGYFAKAMQNSTVQDMYVTLKNAVGTKKDYYGSFLKQVLKDAQNNGVDIKNIVVDKSLISSIKDNLIMGKKMVFSFIKCKLVPEIEAPSLAKDLFVFTYPKHMVTKILNPIDTVTCVFEATQESFNSDLGAKIAVRDLELMGMDDFIYTLE